jgi:hypothetical protein
MYRAEDVTSIDLVVNCHPSGEFTLCQKTDNQLTGEDLISRSSMADFYAEVACYLAELSHHNIQVTYLDHNLE